MEKASGTCRSLLQLDTLSMPDSPPFGIVRVGGLEKPIEQEIACSFFGWKIPALQKCANVKLFTALCAIGLFLQSGLTSGYTYSVLTTIEKKFDMRSVSSGVMASAYEGSAWFATRLSIRTCALALVVIFAKFKLRDGGNLLTILFVSHYGSRQRVPALLGCGSMLMSLGGAAMLLPHVIKLIHYPSGYINHDFSESDWALCNLRLENQSSPNETCTAHELGGQHGLYVGIFFIAQFLLGVGMGPWATLGAAYIDDHVTPREASSFYLSFMYAGAALGPIFGYALGASMLSFDIEHFLSKAPQSMAMDMPNWSGAWWGGYIFFAGLLFQASLVICLFPKSLPAGRNSETSCAPTGEAASLRSMVNASLTVLKCVPFLVITLAACFECAIVSGFLVFLPKYLETQFYVSHSVAGLVTGGVAVPAAAMGIVAGGWINHKYKMTPFEISRFIARTAIVTLIAFVPLFFIYCSPDPPVELQLPKFLPAHGADLVEESPCGHHCACSSQEFQPVCDPETQTSFMSPCIAGCLARNNSVFVECACAKSGTVQEGLCGMKCVKTLIAFLVMIFAIAFLIGNSHLPIVLLTMRSVSSENKSLALAMQMVIIRIVAYIPAPMGFGLIIDGTCLLWSDVTCSEKSAAAKGACLFYDLDGFHRNYACLAFALQVASACFFWFNYYIMRKDSPLKSDTTGGAQTDGIKLRTRISAAVALQPMKSVSVGAPGTLHFHPSLVTA